MASDKWIEFNGVELINLSRTEQLAEVMGIDLVWVSPGSLTWIEYARSDYNYGVIANAPWYDENFPASKEFAGIVPLGFPGLDDSTSEASTVEYIGSGGRTGAQRNGTLSIVASVAIIASTDRGADYGKRWLDRTLRGSAGLASNAGSDLRYYRYAGADAPLAHRRRVRNSRGVSVTRKRSTECSAVWLATFTLNCDDAYEYGEPIPTLAGLGSGAPPSGTILSSGSLRMAQESCPVFNYDPIYDPLRPALSPSPTVPDFYPDGWDVVEGAEFDRFWARVPPVEPSQLFVVPVLKLTTGTDVRMVRVSVFDGDADVNSQCNPLFSAMVTYLPATGDFYIDGEKQAAYVWDGTSAAVRRTDSLVYAPDAKAVEWSAFNDPSSLMVVLDVFGLDPGTNPVRLSVSMVPKSD